MRRRSEADPFFQAVGFVLTVVFVCAGIAAAAYNHATCVRWEEQPVQRTRCITHEGYTTCATRDEVEYVCVERSWP